MIIHIDLYLFITPYKREMLLMKIYLILFLHPILLFFEYLCLFFHFFLFLILLFYNTLSARCFEYIEKEKNTRGRKEKEKNSSTKFLIGM